MAILLSHWHRAVRRLAGQERGSAMVVAVLVSLVVFALGAAWVGIGTHQALETGREGARDKARNAAEAGLNAAMARLAGDPTWSGSDALTPLAGAEFEANASAPFGVADPRRLIVAKGYAPSRSDPRRIARRVEQQVDLRATDGFRYALFSGAGGVSGANNMTVNGDIYSPADITLSNHATVSGSVVSLGRVSTQNNSTIAGNVHAGGDVVLDNPATTVVGNVFSGGQAILTGHVKGSVQAAGTISGGTVDGDRAPFSPPTPPPALSLPTFTWNPAHYPSGTTANWATPSAFQSHWSTIKNAFAGHHRVSCPLPCSTAVALDAKWALTGDATIVADGPLHLSRDVANAAGHPVTLTIVSLATDGILPAITMSNNVVLPDDIRVVFFAPHGSAHFTNLKHFAGAVYAKTIALDQQFTLSFVPLSVPGFDWGPTSASHFEIRAGPFREVPFS